MNARVPNVGSALDDAARALSSTSPTPRLDAEVLLMHVCRLTRAQLIARAGNALDAQTMERYGQLISRRSAGEPVAYITGLREFWSLPLAITPSVLIPRPETELLVERALVHIPRDRPCRVADLGTGSGAVALALASERPLAQIVATDASANALNVARENARALGYTTMEFRNGNWLEALTGEPFDAIVSNPPYVAVTDPHLNQGDARHEPHSALAGGVDGLDAIRTIATDAQQWLTADGRLLLEHGYDQADSVATILRCAGFIDITCHRDLAGQPRVTEARRSVIT